MSGLYTVAQIARYFGSQPQEVARMIKEDGLPAVELPGPARLVKKITLHGLHDWLSETVFQAISREMEKEAA